MSDSDNYNTSFFFNNNDTANLSVSSSIVGLLI